MEEVSIVKKYGKRKCNVLIQKRRQTMNKKVEKCRNQWDITITNESFKKNMNKTSNCNLTRPDGF